MKIAENLPILAVIAVLGGGFAIMVGNFGSSSGPAASTELVIPDLSAPAVNGKTAFNANCLVCHGSDATGSEMGPPLIHKIYNPGHHSDESFFLAGRRGTRQHHWKFGDMPAQPQVSDGQMAMIIQYVREMQVANGIESEPHKM